MQCICTKQNNMKEERARANAFTYTVSLPLREFVFSCFFFNVVDRIEFEMKPNVRMKTLFLLQKNNNITVKIR